MPKHQYTHTHTHSLSLSLSLALSLTETYLGPEAPTLADDRVEEAHGEQDVLELFVTGAAVEHGVGEHFNRTQEVGAHADGRLVGQLDCVLEERCRNLLNHLGFTRLDREEEPVVFVEAILVLFVHAFEFSEPLGDCGGG